jgi:hypothetical protein
VVVPRGKARAIAERHTPASAPLRRLFYARGPCGKRILGRLAWVAMKTVAAMALSRLAPKSSYFIRLGSHIATPGKNSTIKRPMTWRPMNGISDTKMWFSEISGGVTDFR